MHHGGGIHGVGGLKFELAGPRLVPSPPNVSPPPSSPSEFEPESNLTATALVQSHKLVARLRMGEDARRGTSWKAKSVGLSTERDFSWLRHEYLNPGENPREVGGGVGFRSVDALALAIQPHPRPTLGRRNGSPTL